MGGIWGGASLGSQRQMSRPDCEMPTEEATSKEDE
jgi:hypothetical protein